MLRAVCLGAHSHEVLYVNTVKVYKNMERHTSHAIVLKIKMFAEGWVVYPRTSGSPEPTWHEARSAECQVGSGDPRGLGYTTQPSANILIFIIAHVLQLINTI